MTDQAKLSMDHKIKLADGNEIPILGFGTYQITSNTEEIVNYALSCGYKHIDTASIYKNETEVGAAVANSGIKRSELFITTKLWNDDQGKNNVKAAFLTSLKKLKLDYVDLYLIHWPIPDLRMESWDELVKLKEEGLAKSIGVSNYLPKHINEIIHTKRLPVINQVEFSPYLYRTELLDFCSKHNIALQAYSPLVKGKKLDNPVLISIGEKYNKSPAQIILRWLIELNVIILPKSVTKSRIKENSEIFDFSLANEDKKAIAGLNENYNTNPIYID